jgi:(p)ppGpp synthase/HD superfamily hydrolase
VYRAAIVNTEVLMSALSRAVLLAARAHRTQVVKRGEPYILHPLRVMLALHEAKHSPVVQIVGVLHDVVEDTPVTAEEIHEKFGREVMFGVLAVSRRKDETYREFIERASYSEVGRIVKIADIQDNLRPERQTKETRGMQGRYERALHVLMEREEQS